MGSSVRNWKMFYYGALYRDSLLTLGTTMSPANPSSVSTLSRTSAQTSVLFSCSPIPPISYPCSSVLMVWGLLFLFPSLCTHVLSAQSVTVPTAFCQTPCWPFRIWEWWPSAEPWLAPGLCACWSCYPCAVSSQMPIEQATHGLRQGWGCAQDCPGLHCVLCTKK